MIEIEKCAIEVNPYDMLTKVTPVSKFSIAILEGLKLLR